MSTSVQFSIVLSPFEQFSSDRTTTMASFVKIHRKPYEALQSRIVSKPLAGKSVIVTGGSRGVGLFIVEGFVEAGATKIGLTGRDEARLQATTSELEKAHPGVKFTPYAVDVVDEEGIKAMFSDFGVPDILVNNAGVFPDNGLFLDQELEKWWNGIGTKVLGTANVTQKYLQAKGSAPGIVLNCSSMASVMRFPLKGWSGYTTSKLAQARIFEFLRFEHPETRFNTIHPGEIETNGFETSGAPKHDDMTDGKLTGLFFAWAATEEAAWLKDRFLWAEWDIDELAERKEEILEKDLLLTTIDGFNKGF
jgi:NAD(P)-dependent dehydrogenase (short-subunit alcohol dehydrogenase family)